MELHQERILKVLFVLIWILAFTHMVAEKYYLYWLIDWFDILTHFLGGLWVGLAVLWVWYFSGYFRSIQMPDKRAVYIALGAGLLIGLLWEVFEFTVWHWSGEGLPPNYAPDTRLDVVVDTVGALFGYLLFKFLLRESSSTHGDEAE